MKLAMSQLAWNQEEESEALALLQKYGFCGVEIAPTIVAGETPYQHPEKARQYAQQVQQNFGLTVCSMQSIWYGQQGNLFEGQRQELLEYTKKAIEFAQAAGAGNLVFGSPKNRIKPPESPLEPAIAFFKELGDFAALHNTVLALEANPAVYGTNFMNTTPQAFGVMQQVNSPGCRLNLDVGTILINEEPMEFVGEILPWVNHVHISEPQLALLQKRPQHKELASLLRQAGYGGYVSVEMKQQPLVAIEQTAAYIAEVFG